MFEFRQTQFHHFLIKFISAPIFFFLTITVCTAQPFGFGADIPGKPYQLNAKQPHFKFAFQRVFNSLVTGMVFSGCLDPAASKPYDLSYFGIAPDNIHLSEYQRKTLNSQAQESIRYSGLPLNPNNAQNIGSLARLTGRDEKARKRLSRSMKRVFQAPIRLLIETHRPATNVVQLEIKLYGRAASGAYECNRFQTLNVKLPDFQVVERFESEGELVSLAGAFKDSLLNSREEIKQASKLILDVHYNMDGHCPLKQNAIKDFTTAYFRLRDVEFSGIMTSSDWPGLVKASELKQQQKEKPDARMEISFARTGYHDSIVEIVLRFKKGHTLVNQRSYKAVVDRRYLAGCSYPLPGLLDRLAQANDKKGLRFEVQAPKYFLVGKDALQIHIQTGEPLYMYCWYIGEDETAYIVYPWSFAQLKQPWHAFDKKQYPGQFGLNHTQKFKKKVRELFGCFGSRERLPDYLEMKWINSHPFNGGGKGLHKELIKSEVEDIAAQIRKIPEVGYAHVWLKSRWSQ